MLTQCGMSTGVNFEVPSYLWRQFQSSRGGGRGLLCCDAA